jgi:hypothetical protein
VNFTREPIIETIITPKDGYKIVVRSSKGSGQEEYSVDAVEVVSFGNSFFFRCLERPKCFLVPVADYEIIEAKETKVVLKNIAVERAIKIGGGREAPHKPQREQVAEKAHDTEESVVEETEQASSEAPLEHRKRDRKRNRRRRPSDERGEPRDSRQQEGQPGREVRTPAVKADQGGAPSDETPVSSPTFSTLFPPPTTLISETISRYSEAGFLSKPIKKEESTSQGQEEKPTVETFVEEKKDILHQHMVEESSLEQDSSYPSDLEDSEELFTKEKKQASHEEQEDTVKSESAPHKKSNTEDDIL